MPYMNINFTNEESLVLKELKMKFNLKTQSDVVRYLVKNHSKIMILNKSLLIELDKYKKKSKIQGGVN